MKYYDWNEVKKKLKINQGVLSMIVSKNYIIPTTYKKTKMIKREPLYSNKKIKEIKKILTKLNDKKSCYSCLHRKLQEFGFCLHCVKFCHYRRK